MDWALKKNMAPAPSWFKILTWMWQDGDQSAKRKHIFILPLVPNTLVTLKTSVISARLPSCRPTFSLIPYLKSHSEGAKPSNVHLSQWAIYLGNLDS